MADIIIRNARQQDMDRVVRQWLTSFRNSPWAGPIPNNLYFSVYSETIRQLLTRGAKVLVACNADKPDHLVGFVCTEHTPRDNILHYVFIRPMYRENGIASLLLETAGIPKGSPYVYTFKHLGIKQLPPGGRYMRELACRKEAYRSTAEDVSQDLPNPEEVN